MERRTPRGAFSAAQPFEQYLDKRNGAVQSSRPIHEADRAYSKHMLGLNADAARLALAAQLTQRILHLPVERHASNGFGY